MWSFVTSPTQMGTGISLSELPHRHFMRPPRVSAKTVDETVGETTDAAGGLPLRLR
jgi:hypothetical protein